MVFPRPYDPVSLTVVVRTQTVPQLAAPAKGYGRFSPRRDRWTAACGAAGGRGGVAGSPARGPGRAREPGPGLCSPAPVRCPGSGPGPGRVGALGCAVSRRGPRGG
ncbi:hypothetical protein DEH18_28820 [Streptomyces sp. NHF165]|nr:hypothetical protein DEH18_28820 [Streptomyces sp. NHF165]